MLVQDWASYQIVRHIIYNEKTQKAALTSLITSVFNDNRLQALSVVSVVRGSCGCTIL